MLIRINKKANASKPVQYAALTSALNMATTSGIWHDEDSSAMSGAKRRNRIKLTREKRSLDANYDA